MNPLNESPGAVETPQCNISSVQNAVNQALENTLLDGDESKSILQTLQNDIASCTAQTRNETQSLVSDILKKGVDLTFLTDQNTEKYLGFNAAEIRARFGEQNIKIPDIYSVRQDGNIFYFHDADGNALGQYNIQTQTTGEVSGIDWLQKDGVGDNTSFSSLGDIEASAQTSMIYEEVMAEKWGKSAVQDTYDKKGFFEMTLEDFSNNYDAIQAVEILTGQSFETLQNAYNTVINQALSEGKSLGGNNNLLRIEKGEYQNNILSISIGGKIYKQAI